MYVEAVDQAVVDVRLGQRALRRRRRLRSPRKGRPSRVLSGRLCTCGRRSRPGGPCRCCCRASLGGR
eukprot:4807819-Pyramimonas_sp.AAC.1